MILYTPLCETDIFPYQNEHSRRKLIQFAGKTLYVEETEHGAHRLLQLVSTDPQDFLNQSIIPGVIIPPNEGVQKPH